MGKADQVGNRIASMTAHETVTQELADLKTLSREQISERWLALYGHAPPPNTAQPLMVMAVAYKLQEAIHGGLRPTYRRRLQQSVETSNPSLSASLSPGTILVREWHGITYTVTILDKGVQLQGRVYRSLTEVARFITGTHQSGPIFFGLRSKVVRTRKIADG